MAVTRLCPECGKQYLSKTRFCRDDGARLVDAPSQPGTGTANEREAQSRPDPSDSPHLDAKAESKSKPPAKPEPKPDAKAEASKIAKAKGASLPLKSKPQPEAAAAASAAPISPALERAKAAPPPKPSSQAAAPPAARSIEGPLGASAEPPKAVAKTAARDGKQPLRTTGGGASRAASAPVASGRTSSDSRRDMRRESKRDHRGKEADKADPMLGRVIAGRFLLEAVIGAGATGVVYRATHRALNRTMAVKLLKPQFIWDERSLQRFMREARTCSLLDHPNIVYLYDFGRDDRGEPFLVMEFAEGKTLHETIRLSSTLTLPVDRTLAIMTQVARALEHAHGRGVIHRDIKPENIVLTTHEGQPDWVKILDFGVARIVGQAPVTGHGQVTGTAEFIAPETLSGAGTVAPPVDIYAVGMIFHDALIGRPPFTGKLDVVLHQHMNVVPPLLSERSGDPGIPPELDSLVARLLDKDPAKRPNAGDLATELEQLQRQDFSSDDNLDVGKGANGQSTVRLDLMERRTSVFMPRERKTELNDRLIRPTQIVARPSWPTRLSPQVAAERQARTRSDLNQRPSRDALNRDAERQTSALHAAAVTLAAQIWPGGWPQALLNLLQHIDVCEQQERQLAAALHSHEERARKQDEAQTHQKNLRQEILGISERLRGKEKLDDTERGRLYAELDRLERAFFATGDQSNAVPRGVIEPLRQRLYDVQATRRRSRILFARLLVAMPCPPSFEEERRIVAQLLLAADPPTQ